MRIYFLFYANNYAIFAPRMIAQYFLIIPVGREVWLWIFQNHTVSLMLIISLQLYLPQREVDLHDIVSGFFL